MPEYKGKSISAEILLQKIQEAESHGCIDEKGNPILTIIDYRVEEFFHSSTKQVSIKTKCKTIQLLFDDLRKPEIREKIPNKGIVVLICETGNRDSHVMKYLYKYGYTNILGLQFGMRRWIKLNYPVDGKK